MIDSIPHEKLKSGFGFGGVLSEIGPKTGAGDSPHEDHDLSIDEYWMTEALKESLKSMGLANPNPAVGCVIVKDGVEIARGHTQVYGGLHAERAAFMKIADKKILRGATVYVTLEPCSHFGHQPPCADLLASSEIKRVVVGRGDPDARVSGRGISKLIANDKIVTKGLLSSEITAWNYPFFLSRTQSQPMFAAMWEQKLTFENLTLVETSDHRQETSSQSYSQWLRQKYDLVLTDFEFMFKNLSQHARAGKISDQMSPNRFIYDSDAQIFNLPEADFQKLDVSHAVVILTDEQSFHLAPKGHWAKSNALVQWALLPEKVSKTVVTAIIEKLKLVYLKNSHKTLQSILLEGSPTFLTHLFKEQVPELIHIFASDEVSPDLQYPSLSELTRAHFEVLATATLQKDFLIELTPNYLWEKLARV